MNIEPNVRLRKPASRDSLATCGSIESPSHESDETMVVATVRFAPVHEPL